MSSTWLGRYRAYSIIWNDEGMGIHVSARSEKEARSITILLYPQLESVPLDIEDLTDDYMDNPFAPSLRQVLREACPGLIVFDEAWEEWKMEIPLEAWSAREPVEVTEVEKPTQIYVPPSITMKQLSRI